MKDVLYLRGLRRVDHSVFSVADGQKTYWEPQFRRTLPFSSGQQVKRSILDALVGEMGIGRAPVEFQYKLEKKKDSPSEDIALQQLDPRNPDELLGGWMRASAKGTKTDEDDYQGVLKRRSPLSISAMHALHPLLAGTDTEDSITFDRTDDGNSSVKLLNQNGEPMSKEEMLAYLREKDLFLRKAKYVDARNQKRAYGLFVYDIAIDLRRLFTVSIDETAPEIDPNLIPELEEQGWEQHVNVFGPALLAPEATRAAILPALAEALIEWHITSNQARTHSTMPMLAVALSDKASNNSVSIRARLEQDENGRPIATPILEDSLGGLYVHPSAEGYIAGAHNLARANALEQAKQDLLGRLQAYNYAQRT